MAFLPRLQETYIFLLIDPRLSTGYPSVTVDPLTGPEHILTRTFATKADAYEYIHQYTVNATDRQFRLVVTDYTGRAS